MELNLLLLMQLGTIVYFILKKIIIFFIRQNKNFMRKNFSSLLSVFIETRYEPMNMISIINKSLK